MMKNGVFYFGTPEIFKFLLKKLMTSQTLQMTVVNHKIENTSENIEVMIFKLGTNNVHQIRHSQSGTH